MDRARSGPVECRAARDYVVTVIMQKLAVEWRSTLSSIGHSRMLVESQSTCNLPSTLYRGLHDLSLIHI